MLPDNDDLLNQLSCELGLSDFMDDGSSILADGRSGANLYDQFLSSSENEEHALFNELILILNNFKFYIIFLKECAFVPNIKRKNSFCHLTLNQSKDKAYICWENLGLLMMHIVSIKALCLDRCVTYLKKWL